MNNLTEDQKNCIWNTYQACFQKSAYPIGGLWTKEQLFSPRHFVFMTVDFQDKAFVVYQNLEEECEILMFCIAPHLWGKSISAGFLVNFLHSLSSNMRSVILEVNALNLAAVALYQRQGFLEEGRRKNYYAQGQDAILMRLQIQ